MFTDVASYLRFSGIAGEVTVAPRSVWTWKCNGSVAVVTPSHIVHHLD